jgi:hypothetical protein
MGGLGGTGSGLTTLQQTAASVTAGGANNVAVWGYDLLGSTYVSNQAQFNAAVALLRTPAGRPTGDEAAYVPPPGWAYPPAWRTVESNLATVDTSVNSAEMTGTSANTVDTLAQMDISVLAVEFLPWCARVLLLRRWKGVCARGVCGSDVCACVPVACASPPFVPGVCSGNYVFTTMDPNNPVYWAERWELFKHTYVVAGWGWKRAVTKVEYWVRLDANM